MLQGLQVLGHRAGCRVHCNVRPRTHARDQQLTTCALGFDTPAPGRARLNARGWAPKAQWIRPHTGFCRGHGQVRACAQHTRPMTRRRSTPFVDALKRFRRQSRSPRHSTVPPRLSRIGLCAAGPESRTKFEDWHKDCCKNVKEQYTVFIRVFFKSVFCFRISSPSNCARTGAGGRKHRRPSLLRPRRHRVVFQTLRADQPQ